jgi:potassium efflux system protein|tara:strand:+ start:1506 stop:1895 length:390 start_codon:yes stop_codon:yes gene_type:complete
MDDFLKTVLGYVMPAYDVALAWIIDPANWVQVALLVGAYVVGIGFGLQKIASNFVSGVILLLEGQATVGDYVELDGGEAGTIVKMTARAAILETFDGKWIVVPNEDFIVTWVINYSDSGSANRDEVFFP